MLCCTASGWSQWQAAFPRALWLTWNPALNLFELRPDCNHLHYTTDMQKKNFQTASCSSTFWFFKYKAKETFQKDTSKLLLLAVKICCHWDSLFLVEKCLLLKVTELWLSNKLRNKWLLTLPDDDSSVQELHGCSQVCCRPQQPPTNSEICLHSPVTLLANFNPLRSHTKNSLLSSLKTDEKTYESNIWQKKHWWVRQPGFHIYYFCYWQSPLCFMGSKDSLCMRQIWRSLTNWH